MNKNKIFSVSFIIIIFGIIIYLFPKDIIKKLSPSEKPTPLASVVPSQSLTTSDIAKVLVKLNSQNNQEPGAAIIKKAEKEITLDLNIPDTLKSYSGFLYKGRCISLGQVDFPLNNISDGKSLTKLNISMSSLTKNLPMAIVVSSNKNNVYCGDILIR